MKQILNSIKKSKQILFDKFAISSETSEIEIENQDKLIKYNILKDSSSLTIPIDFDKHKFINELEVFMKEVLYLKIEISELEEIKIYKYNQTKGLKSSLGISGTFILFLLIDENLLLFDVKPSSWLDNWNKKPTKLSITKLVQDTLENNISEFISNHILNNCFTDNQTFEICQNSTYIEPFNLKEKIWFLCEKNKDDILLANLEISEFKKIPEQYSDNSKLKWNYILTNQNAFIVGFNEKSDITHQIDISENILSVKNEIGRIPVKAAEIEWLSTRNNKNLYQEIKDFTTIEQFSRINEFSRINWLKKDKSNSYSKYLLQELQKRRNNSLDEFSSLFIDFSENNEIMLNQYSKDEKVINLIKRLLSEEKINDKLIDWAEKWNISSVDSFGILQLFLKIAEDNSQLEKFLAFHKKVRAQVLKNEKDKINLVLFDIDFCKHLIKCNEKKEAIKIIETNLKSLPDESLSDLLPPKNLDLTGKAGGQVLRVILMELLASAQEKNESIPVLQQLTMLQPLSKERLDSLIEISTNDLQSRTKELRQLLEPEKLNNPLVEYKDLKYNSLGTQNIDEKLKHPSTRKGGSLASIQTWLATVKIPDYTVIKSYSEPLTSRNYSKVNDIVTDIKVAFSLDGVETYIARGDKSIGINSFEGANPFLIIGGNHLTQDTPHFLTLNELKFAIGVELAHLYFKHSRVTSTDVWRGAIEKGTWVFETVISILPVVGILGKTLGSIEKLNSLAQLLQKSEKISKVTSKSQEVISTTTQAVNIYKTATKKDEKSDKEKELLAISRILQLTADRAGILFCGDMKTAIRAIFLTSPKYASDLPIVERYGITEYLLKKDDSDNYIYQDLAIRFASLFSFYMSDDYILLRDKLINKK